MYSTSHASAGDRASEPSDTFAWVMAPSQRIRRRYPLIATLVTMTFLCALVLFHSLALALVSVGLIAAPVIGELVPIGYRMSPEGVRVSLGPVTWLEMPWREIRCIACVPRGLKLSPFDNPATSLLESRRGITLRYPASIAETVERLVAQWHAAASDRNHA